MYIMLNRLSQAIHTHSIPDPTLIKLFTVITFANPQPLVLTSTLAQCHLCNGRASDVHW